MKIDIAINRFPPNNNAPGELAGADLTTISVQYCYAPYSCSQSSDRLLMGRDLRPEIQKTTADSQFDIVFGGL